MDENSSNKKEEFKVVICGSRKFTDYNFLKTKCDAVLKRKRETCDIVIISGAAKGADSLGEQYAIENNFRLIRIPANWDKYGKRAGFIRNERMAELANASIGFIMKDIPCPGTEMMLRISEEKNLLVRRFTYPEESDIEPKEKKEQE